MTPPTTFHCRGLLPVSIKQQPSSAKKLGKHFQPQSSRTTRTLRMTKLMTMTTKPSQLRTTCGQHHFLSWSIQTRKTMQQLWRTPLCPRTLKHSLIGTTSWGIPHPRPCNTWLSWDSSRGSSRIVACLNAQPAFMASKQSALGAQNQSPHQLGRQ